MLTLDKLLEMTLPVKMPTKLKILMLTSSYPKFSGDVTAPFIEAIAQNTQALDHEVTVLMAYHPDLQRQAVENGVSLQTFKYAPLRSWNIWGYAASLEADVKVRKTIYFLLPLVLISSFFKMWRLTGREQFDVIQAHWVIPNAPVAVLVGWLRKLPVVISLHGSDVYIAERLKPVGWVARWAFRRAAAVTASSPDLLARAQKLGAPTDPARGVVIPYGADPTTFHQLSVRPLFQQAIHTKHPAPVDTDFHHLRKRLHLESSSQILLCVGRLVYKKGFEYAIRALPAVLQDFPQTQLVIAGKGDLLTELQALAAEIGVTSHVRFVGAVPHNQVVDYLRACDLFLLPSVIDKNGNVDGLPNTLLEALAVGKAVVASEVAGVPLAVRDGENGRLVPPGDATKLASVINELLGNSVLRQRYGQAARQVIEQELNWPKIAGRYVQVFHTACS
jgi:glycosyltransferase involved in cell wall biosynthesis